MAITQSNLGKAILNELRRRYVPNKPNIIWIPTVSMRSYESGIYDLNCDGNIMQMLHVLSDVVKEVNKISVIVPSLSEDLDKSLIDSFELTNKIEFFCIDYGKNIAETREKFNNSNILQAYLKDAFKTFEDTIIISDFEVCFNFCCPVIYRFNVSPERWKDRQTMLSIEYPTFTLNENQLQYGEMQTHWFNKKAIIKLSHFCQEGILSGPTLFLPFRLSDKDYHIDEILEYAELSGTNVFVTDPNESIDKINSNAKISVNKEFRKKTKLFSFLRENADNPFLVIPYLSNPTKILHQSFLEMMTLCQSRLRFPWYCEHAELIEYFDKVSMKDE